MAKATSSQSSFIAGELDPRLTARIDADAYSKGAQTLTNVICLGQGGVKRRPGMRFVGEMTEATAKFVTFEFNLTQTYLLVFTHLKMYVYKDGEKQTNINDSGNDYLETAYTSQNIKELGVAQSADTLIVCHNYVKPTRIVRGSDHNLWELKDISFSNYPTFDFKQNYDGVEFTQAGASGVLIGATVTITASSPVMTPSHAGGIFRGNEGIFRINSYNSSTQVTCTVLQETINTNVIAGSNAWLEEPVWSDEHGYPGTVTFHEARLWLSNSTKRPQTLWGSNIGDFYNFDVGFGDDGDCIDVTLDSDKLNVIHHLVSGRHLQVFTSGAEFFIPTSPITPKTIAVTRQTAFGTTKALRPVDVDGGTVFVQRNGKQVREYLYENAQKAYTSGEVNLLAPHLLNSPVAMASQIGDVHNEGNYLYVVNADGTVAVFISNRQEEVTAWTRFTTAGEVKDVAVIEDIVYFLVKRNLNGADKYLIEALDHDHYMDSSSSQASCSAPIHVIGCLDHLIGVECRVRANGVVRSNETVPDTGWINLGGDVDTAEAGLNFDVEVTTMPVNVVFSSGSINVSKRRILKVSAVLHETAGIKINGKRIADRAFGDDILDSPSVLFTGIRTVAMLGYSKTSQVTVTQTDPAPMTLLGLTLELQAQGG